MKRLLLTLPMLGLLGCGAERDVIFELTEAVKISILPAKVHLKTSVAEAPNDPRVPIGVMTFSVHPGSDCSIDGEATCDGTYCLVDATIERYGYCIIRADIVTSDEERLHGCWFLAAYQTSTDYDANLQRVNDAFAACER